MNKIAEQIQRSEKKPVVLITGIGADRKAILAAQEIKDKMTDIGIQNVTTEYLATKLTEKAEQEKKDKINSLNNEVLILLKENFPFNSILSYGSMIQVAKDHNLFITGIQNYKKEVPEENIEEIHLFFKSLSDKPREVVSKMEVGYNSDLLCDKRYRNTSTILQRGKDTLLYIMAPKSHLKKSKNHITIGREINDSSVVKPKFTYEFKVNQPEPHDPVVFLPVWIAKELYCIVITAWDKVADDLRIRAMI